MKTALIFLLLPLSANASFLCDGRKIISNQGAIYNFNSNEECITAVNNSKNGFTCDGRKLITLNGSTTHFGSDVECELAVQNSK